MKSLITTAHNPERRAEASADPRTLAIQQLDLSDCAEGNNPSGGWTPVRGPHLKTLRMRDKRNNTGVAGISYARTYASSKQTKSGVRRKYDFFYVNLGTTSRRINITTLGKEEAWRRALKLRAQHETRIREINSAIKTARKKNRS